jgi:hypothetical protein
VFSDEADEQEVIIAEAIEESNKRTVLGVKKPRFQAKLCG